VKKELHDTRKEAAIAQHQLSLALVEIKRLQNENEKALILQTELISSFDELKCEVEAGISIADSLQSTFAETTQSFAIYQRYLQAQPMNLNFPLDRVLPCTCPSSPNMCLTVFCCACRMFCWMSNYQATF
jgi:hypothetical protein